MYTTVTFWSTFLFRKPASKEPFSLFDMLKEEKDTRFLHMPHSYVLPWRCFFLNFIYTKKKHIHMFSKHSAKSGEKKWILFSYSVLSSYLWINYFFMLCIPTYGSGGTFYGTQVICCYLLPPKKAPSVLRNTYTPPRGNDTELIPMYLVV